MTVLIAVAGYLGAWLLVAGPVYQAAVELDAEQVDRAGFERADRAVPPTRHISPWWWLLPPVAMVRQRRAARERRMAMMRALSVEQLSQLLGFGAKATGWLLVASGGALIAVKESWELTEAVEWAAGWFWALVLVGLVPSLFYAVLRLRKDRGMLALKREMEQEDRAAQPAS